MSRQTFYDHFPTLDDVVAEAFARYRARVGVHLAELGLGADLPALLGGLVDAFFAAMEPDNVRMRQEIAAHLVKGLNVAQWLEEPLFRIVSDGTAAAQKEGTVRSDLDADDVARLILTSLSGFLLIESEPPARRARRARLSLEILFAGLQP